MGGDIHAAKGKQKRKKGSRSWFGWRDRGEKVCACATSTQLLCTVGSRFFGAGVSLVGVLLQLSSCACCCWGHLVFVLWGRGCASLVQERKRIKRG